MMAMGKQNISFRERIKSEPAEVFIDAYMKPSIDLSLKYIFDYEIDIHFAHGLMLMQQNIVSDTDIIKIFNCLLAIKRNGYRMLDIEYSQEDIYACVETYLIKELGPEIGGKLHTGRSRNDLHATSWRMALRDRLLEILYGLCGLRDIALKIAEDNSYTVMPGYTHSQQAQPISLGYYFLAVADNLQRDFTRLQQAMSHVDLCPLGSGALSTSAYPIDRQLVADLLGFGAILEIAYDAVSSRDDIHQTSSGLAILMNNLSRVAVDLQNWNTLEYGFIEIGDSYSTSSSIMPQKKNPQPLELTKANSAKVFGYLVSVFSSTKNTSLSDVYDGVTAINESIMHATAITDKTLKLFAGMIESLKLNKDRMLSSVKNGYSVATEYADLLVRQKGISFRIAHSIIGAIIAKKYEQADVTTAISPQDILYFGKEFFGLEIVVSEDELADAANPLKNIESRTAVGGPSPGNFTGYLQSRTEQLQRDRSDIVRQKNSIGERRTELYGRINALV